MFVSITQHTVLSNLQFNLFFQCWKKVPKINQYICPSYTCLSNIITLSMISLIMFTIKYFFVLLEDWELPQYSLNLMKKEKIRFFWVILIEFEKVNYFFKLLSIDCIQHNSFEVKCKSLKREVHRKCMLMSSRTKFI